MLQNDRPGVIKRRMSSLLFVVGGHGTTEHFSRWGLSSEGCVNIP